ncbi:MAG: SDR family NAD(P)-dependent oxidoreductase [Spongiibacteraceae bacterium]
MLKKQGNKLLTTAREKSHDDQQLLTITPCEHPDIPLARALLRHGANVAIDIGRDEKQWPELFESLKKIQVVNCGIRVPDHVEIDPALAPSALGFVVLGDTKNIALWKQSFCVFAQVTSIEQARIAIEAGAHALIAKGQESAGLVGNESSFILLQRLQALPELADIPIWCQGGIGLHTAAAAIAGGARGVVLDSQLALLNECSLPREIKNAIAAMDGSETRTVGDYQFFARPGSISVGIEKTLPHEMRARLGGLDTDHYLPLGQDGALAKLLAEQCPNAEALVNSFRSSIAAHIRQAQALNSLAENSPLARVHGTRYPIAQGPMTRVSDTAAFANAVAENGALPFLALSLMNAKQSRELLEQTRAMIGEKTWGVGVLGFASPEILNPQLDLIREFKPDVVLLAGGRPSQARPLNELGIATYLHVPSPRLLDMFLQDGARHFVFEGRECGGHVGPRFSFVLWEQQLQVLLNFDRADELHILFAGGIHDERSAAMIAVMAAPLAARGAKIGVLMGTAYIATHEAVKCEAIIPNFQQQAIGSEETVLIETAPGHAVRCLQSEFVEQFHVEKQRLQNEGLDQQTIWARLEDLNVGRLRIATKGVARSGDKLVTVDQHRQHSDGMYMIGQLIALRKSVCSMADLHRSVSNGAMEFLQRAKAPTLPRANNAEPIAVIGMECIYPGSPDLESFWANILAAKDLVSEVPAERWNADLYYREGSAQKGKSPSKWGGFIDDIAFDPLSYGIPPQSLAAIEPVQLLSLEVARRALRDAGYDESEKVFDREKTAVIFGAESGMDLGNNYAFRNMYPHYLGELPPELDAVLPDLTEDSFPGVLVNVISGRIANRLGLGGVNYSVDSACASSLTAIELAVKELRAGSSDMVLAGGADFHNSINDFLMFASVGALSAKGRCRSFDNSADGICLGEGVGVVVLKRLEDAERDGDRIYAVIDGVAGSSDGKGLGLTAPRKEGQKRALERAYWQAGVLPADIGLVEAHGTGTVVGDKTELQTLTEIFTAGGALPAQADLGSVKSQIGHTKCAAGIAGLIKISKALYHRVLPPTLHIETPNNGYRVQSSPFVLQKAPRPWFTNSGIGDSDNPRRAAVSAFGFGGANFHAVLSSYASHNSSECIESGAAYWNAELFVFRGENFAIAQSLMQQFADYLRGSNARLTLRDLSFTAQGMDSGTSRDLVQCAFVARDCNDLAEKLRIATAHGEHVHIFYRDKSSADEKIAFVFPGQGSQTPNMLADLFVAFPHLQYLLEADADCASILFPPTVYTREEQQAQQRAITDTRVAQPTLGMVEFAAFELLKAMNIEPAMAAGHSYGELMALASAGCFDASTLIRLSRQRGESILAAAGDDPGKMAAVSSGYAELQKLFGADSGVVLANQNSKTQTVISGSTSAIDAALALLKEKNISAKPIETACAFHSPIVERAQGLFDECLRDVAIVAPAFPVYANTTAQIYAHDGARIKQQLGTHIVRPVRFVEQIEKMYADGARVFVEVGPKRVLSGLIKNILGEQPHRLIAIDDGKQADIGGFLTAVAQLAVMSDVFDPAILYAGRNARTLDLSKPNVLPATCWMVNGGRARPLKGNAPAHAGKAITEPLRVAAITALAHSPVIEDNAVIDYLTNMREMVRAQRDVLLGFFGQPAGNVEHAARPIHHAQPVEINLGAQTAIEITSALPLSTAAASVPQVDVQTTLLDIVSERTGYPSEMLDLDLDLEADLSIDSIKRVEIVGELAARLLLRDRHGANADVLLEQLSAKKNLRTIIDWLKQNAPAAAPAITTVGAPLAAPVPTTSAVTEQDVKAVLLAIVSERTGYPTEMLDLDLDLEADLSIDSIKRVEIVGELAARLHLREAHGTSADTLLEALSAKKNLRAILHWLEQSQPATDAVKQEAAAPVPQQTDTAIPLTRYVLQSFAAPRVVVANNHVAGKHFLITNDSFGIAPMLADRLRARGAEVRVFNFVEDNPAPLLKSVDGIIHLWSLNSANRVRDVKRFFELVRDAVEHDTRYVLTVSGLGGDFGRHLAKDSESVVDFGCGAGLAGLIKTLGKEHPQLQAQWIDLDVREAIATLVAHLETELLAENKFAEIGYRDGKRMLRRCIPVELPAVQADLDLDENSVVLLTGGARGITAKLAIELAQRYRCTLELVGRSELPTGDEFASTASARDAMELRKVIIKTEAGLKPAEVEKRCAKILAEREMRATMNAIAAAGARVNYTALDVRDVHAFGNFIEQLYVRYPRIDGVIHGAGVIEDKLLRDKSVESFERVFDTKVRGALMLYNLLRDDVKFVVFFSSVASAFGNRGQIDYAAANDVLDKMAPALRARIGGRVLSVNWGPWAGTGMVSPQLERDYASKGIGLIPLQAGIDALLNELARDDDETTQVVLMCGSPEAFGAENTEEASVTAIDNRNSEHFIYAQPYRVAELAS